MSYVHTSLQLSSWECNCKDLFDSNLIEEFTLLLNKNNNLFCLDLMLQETKEGKMHVAQL